MPTILRCNQCRRELKNKESVDKILSKQDEYKSQFFIRSKEHGVGKCILDGCFGEYFPIFVNDSEITEDSEDDRE